MKIRHLEIKNYRGIKFAQWCLPSSQIVSLIGKGDSCKTTILDSIRLVFYPHWALQLSDVDFYRLNVNEPIVIRATIGGLAEDLLSIGKYGLHLRGWDAEEKRINDEPLGDVSEDEPVLTVELRVGADLEPQWRVVTDRNPEGVNFGLADRKRLNATFIGAYSNRLLTWDSQSPLSKLTEKANFQSSLANATRAARAAFDNNRSEVEHLDHAAEKVFLLAKKLGVNASETFLSHLDLGAINIKAGGVSLHDGDIPLRQLGLGSKRMLSCGIQSETLENQHITLVDEIESGLEPHRISRLIKHFKEDEQGCYLFTTHSPIVLRELNFEELNVVHNREGFISIRNISDKSLFSSKVQGIVRSHADAFLCPKVIVCEGATEVGFVRGMDDYYVSEGNESFSYYGVSYLDASGCSNVKPKAEVMDSLGYQVAAFVDSDAQDKFGYKDKEQLEERNVVVVMWEGEVAIEERLFFDLPWSIVVELLNWAKEELGLSVVDNVLSKFGEKIPDNINEWQDNRDYRIAIGKAAKSSGWFKNITFGEKLGKVTTGQFTQNKMTGTDTHIQLEKLRGFIQS